MAGRAVASSSPQSPWWFAALGATTTVGALGYTFLPASEPAPRAYAFIGLQLALMLPVCAALWWKPDHRIPLVWIVGVAVAARLACLPGELIFENDVFRYLWDARVSAHGINPYRFAPADPGLAALVDDWVFPQVPYPQVPTIYPPLAQVAFLFSRAVFGESVFGLQAVMIAADLGTMLAVFALGRSLGSPRAAAAYALHPLALKEFSQAAHIDALAVCLFTWALYAAVRGKRAGAAGAVAAAALTKVFPLATLPAFLRRIGPRWAMAAGALCALPFAALMATGLEPWRGLSAFAHYWIFNPSLYDLVARVLALRVPIEVALTWARPLCMLIAAALIVWRSWRCDPKDDRAWLTCVLAVLMTLLVWSPAANPWYIAWLVPLAVLLQHPAALAWTGTASLAYGFYTQGNDDWRFRAAEYVPVFVLWARYAFGNRALKG